ncbi:hypothetical protein CVT24_001384 [Panaeolus cyanescens]|uniref:Uncharacterized protein n=1 Tax=Panaeolus cyanescens TaxID=181874 RepID=A0A409YU45_9AGAR|nr:hypothetical protein CVT24_001384 [Panaeolus cyanescens]
MDPTRRTTRSYTRQQQQQTQQPVIQEDSEGASDESLHGATPPPPFTPAATAPTLPGSASTVPMPGSFAPPAYNAANANQTNPAVQATASTIPQVSTVASDNLSGTRRSPNPFLSTTPMGTPQALRATHTLQNPATMVTFAPTQTQIIPTTPRMTVPVFPANTTSYHSPGDSGMGNFGQSMTQTNLWEDNDSPPPGTPVTGSNDERPGYGANAMQQGRQGPTPTRLSFGSVNANQDRRDLSVIPESDELEYVDEEEEPVVEIGRADQQNESRLPPLHLAQDIEDPQRRGVGVEELNPIDDGEERHHGGRKQTLPQVQVRTAVRNSICGKGC